MHVGVHDNTVLVGVGVIIIVATVVVTLAPRVVFVHHCDTLHIRSGIELSSLPQRNALSQMFY